MAKRLRSLRGGQESIIVLPVATSQTIVKGDLLVMSSGYAAKAGAAASKVIGLAMAAITTGESVDSEDVIPVSVIDEFTVLKMASTGTFTAAALYTTAYDIGSTQVVDQADTTGGFLIPLKYDNTAHTIECVVKQSALWNA